MLGICPVCALLLDRNNIYFDALLLTGDVLNNNMAPLSQEEKDEIKAKGIIDQGKVCGMDGELVRWEVYLFQSFRLILFILIFSNY